MKRILTSFCVAIALVTAPVAFNGCGTTGTLAISAQSTDQIILRAEQTAQTARLTFDTFVTLERHNEALLKQVNPQIHVYANVIRANGLNWVDSLTAAINNFEANKTPTNQASLNTVLATLTGALADVNKYLAQSKQAIAKQ